MEVACYDKLQLRKAGLFRITNMEWHTVKIDKSCVLNTKTISQVEGTPRLESNNDVQKPRPARQDDETQTKPETEDQPNSQVGKNVYDKASKQVEWAIEKIGGLKSHG